MSFGVSPVNYSDSDSELPKNWKVKKLICLCKQGFGELWTSKLDGSD